MEGEEGKNKYQLRILYSVNISFKKEGGIKTPAHPYYLGNTKGALQVKGKWFPIGSSEIEEGMKSNGKVNKWAV